MTEQLFLPESMYDIDSEMNYQKLVTSFKNRTSITGKIIRLNSVDNCFEVDLGNNFIGIMPLKDSTIYQIYKDNGRFSYGLIGLVGKTIRAKIVNLENNNIILSRIENMLEALETLKNTTTVKFAAITSFSHLSAFIDIGGGISGKATTSNYSNTIFRSATDIGFKKGDILPVTITGFHPEINCFDLSVVDNFEEAEKILNLNDIVTCKVFGSVGDNLGYYVLANKKCIGIVDSPFHKLYYGDEISAAISKITTNGLRLKIIEKL